MLNIRAFDDADSHALASLWRACDLVRPYNDPATDISQARASGCAEIFVGEINGHIVASVLVGDDGHRGWLYYVAVDPAHRGKGFGRQIVAAAEHWLKLRGREKAQLMIRSDNSAVQDFYAALGYGEQERVLMGRWLDGRPLTP